VTAPHQLTLTALPGIPLVRPGDDLTSLVLGSLQAAEIELHSGDVLVVAQKIVSKAEGRLICLNDVAPSPRAEALGEEIGKDPRLVEVILRESAEVVRSRPGLLVVEHRLGFVSANAGVDHSNVAGKPGRESEPWVLLLPEDPDSSAKHLGEAVQSATGADIGVLIIDSHGRAWRMGTVGVAIGIFHFPGLLDLRGRPDLFGEPLKITQVGLADEIAAGASALMGQADEGRPVIHVRGLPYPLRDGSLDELLRPKSEDLFR
jgi:coenzyme F420-0:L-glutamate ligase/coenzyme F420-1:gamma-L-glutamate ligase